MTDFDMEDSLTKLNTQLNKSMVLMDNTETGTSQRRSNKSIKINTKIQRSSLPNLPISRKSILKRPEKRNVVEAENNEETLSETNDSRLSLNVSTVRPHNINDLVQQEDLIAETTDTTFDLDDLSDSEDIWIMDIPGTVNPQELKGQTLVFGEKSKFKINEEKYYAVNHEVKCNVTCVFHAGKMKSQYKTVNMKPAGTITVRRKLSNVSKIEPMQIKNCSVPFPKNLRTRHPLFGVQYKGNIGIVQ
ncbi:hypothetical protein E2986_07899 [Frieseomelitta varia]|uniref:Uncharacterized protein n=1 Tax=Frieseomelitta varia TaxID=561572 RepID=A0A833S493_9HYME|nr:uncharacterized protein LOC122532765 [Frieseomelitta varia]KAF3424415.1 hypothetical protein E2986_07899 [Frieseomelitta varia]